MSNSNEIKRIFPDKQSAEKPVEAQISRMGEVEKFSNEKLNELKIVYSGSGNDKNLNIFRELRTQLMQKNHKKNFVCMVSSIISGGGASYISSNLGAVFALDKAKTSMLIDANLYNPSVDRIIVGDCELGITDFLSDPSLNIEDVVYATGVPRLRAIPIGDNREGAAEYFSSEKMLAFVDEIRGRYSDRYVFIDSPPIAESSEARILAELVDLVLLVVPYGKVTMAQIDNAVETVGKDKLSGLVYNN